MIKVLRSLGVFLGALLFSSFANAATCITCTQGGGCMTFYCGVGPIDYDWIAPGLYASQNVPVAYLTSLTTQVMSHDALVQKNCGNVRGEIEAKKAYCNQAASKNNTTATDSCGTLKNYSLTKGFEIFFGSYTATIEQPTYDKCINKVAAFYEDAKDACQSSYVDDINLARNKMPATCASVFNF